tara:strand:+ start:1594 stop:2028 length:435 start_codon:yes stop_codon:yes gene_type:complete
MKKTDLKKFKKENPYSFLPYLINLPHKSNNNYEKNLNSLALRHPDRIYLKSFLKKITIDQDQIINNFIDKKPKVKSKKSTDNLKDLSIPKNKKRAFLSENMAKILIKQNNISDAIKIYEKLISNNSKKKIYFAKKIKELKKKDV